MKAVARTGLALAAMIACAGPVAAAPAAACKVAVGDTVLVPNLAAGARVYLRCRSCHTLGAGEKNLVGPNLSGMFGRKSGTAAGFKYSPAFAKAPPMWTDQALSAFLEKPTKAIPGSKMIFVGLPKPQDRADLIGYLREQTGGPACGK